MKKAELRPKRKLEESLRRHTRSLGKVIIADSLPSPKTSKKRKSLSAIKSAAQSTFELKSAQNESEETTALENAIDYVLSANYFDIVERLKMVFPAKCLHALRNCKENHHRNENMQHSGNTMSSQTFLKHGQPLMFIHSTLMDVTENKFPGGVALMSLFEIILAINEPTHDDYKVANVIDMAAFTINNIMEKFPPCWYAANLEYRSFVKTKSKQHIQRSNELLPTRTLFDNILHCLEDLVQPPKSSAVVQDANSDPFSDSLEILNFHKFESMHAQKFSFDTLERDEKIERLFLALSLFVQLFEADLAMWTISNIRNPGEKMFSDQKNPLIVSLLWARDELHEVNYYIKNLLKLYVTYVTIDFPREYTSILGRLVNIIFNIFELLEIKLSKAQFEECNEYPRPIEHQLHFCDSFTKIIFDNCGSNIQSWLNVIRSSEHPRLKHNLITALLTKIDNKKVTLNPKNIGNTLAIWENEFDDDTNTQNNNNVKKVEPVKNPVPVMKYPYVQKTQRRIQNELTYEQQVELHLTALNAYISIFRTNEVKQQWANHTLGELCCIRNEHRYLKELEIFQLTAPQPIDLKQMEKLLESPFDERVKAIGAISCVYSLDVINRATKFRFHPQTNIRKYRDDFKYIDMISTGMPKLFAKFRAFFPKQI